MNIKGHIRFFSIYLGIIGLANIVGIIVGLIIGNFDLFFIISLLSTLVALLAFVFFVQRKVKFDYLQEDATKVIESKRISVLVLGISLIFFAFAIILSYV